MSAFNVSGVVPTGTTKFEKRGIAVEVPVWQSENCIQCNQCSLVCPHACIRPVLIDENEKTPDGFVTKPATGVKGAKYRIQVSPLDCTGCGSCANVCPAKQKALVMTPADKVNETENWEFAEKVRQVESGLNKFSGQRQPVRAASV